MRFDITRETYHSAKLRTPHRIVQVSDLHDFLYGAEQSALIDAIRAEQPERIVCTGDLLNRRNANAFQNALLFVRRAVEIAPVLIVEGNHEAALGETAQRHLETMRSYGAAILRNETIEDGEVRWIGLRQRASREVLAGLIRPDRFNLVLCHRPELFPTYAGIGADLILCGHAHGGQIRIGNVPLYAPQQGWFPRYTAGLYEQDGTRMFVSRGLGDTVPVPRIRVPHEWNVHTLLPDGSAQS